MCYASLRGVGVGVATILPTEKASVQRPRTNELNSVDNHQGDTILSKSVILRKHHLTLGGAKCFTFLPLHCLSDQHAERE